ncbi:RNA polymerase sigma factor [Micromonospora vinacea]|uniref:RNA polymerase sigma factor (Sigma-70 family) n=1 Tax=Micromonospora vinacea TaxID=709878 RepID=A0ABS0JVY1_9ACTN|nr:sigma-70 family RNA polymerase sigma factor [Micromonospora vinacea]MBG6100511.1 RNA polymerase sigma factor (sigma-70 family) [Micromonospora vinacea]WSZ76559.1 sigma-70 family RNA polymerase sigma factor [Micromonospora sp. NBC_00860]WTA66957.1 sigma-70 family RNA polymerase sigma factor [Micromonospora sp. NBC_00855]
MTPDVEYLLRTEAPQVLGALVRRFGHFDIAEDAVQEALLAASRMWPADGVPENPRSWLIRIGYRRMVDLLRTDQARRRRERHAGLSELAMRDPSRRTGPAPETDDSLTLLLLCCHPALSPTSRVALTLRAVGGLTTTEIAHAYGTTENTTGARISRAKQQLARAGARFTPPTDADRDSRLNAVMQVLYLIFNEGYTASTGDELARVDLTREAIRLTRMLRDALPGDPEVTGLLALMLLTESRRAARTDGDELVPLDEQDRTRWDHELIREGTELIDSVWPRREIGAYQLQAAIAAVHTAAASPDRTDWPQIAALYLGLEHLSPTAPVRLSRVVAVAHAYGPARGLALLDNLNRSYHLDEEPLTRQRERAIRAHLLEMTGDTAGAATWYREAAALTQNQVEQRYLQRRATASADRSSVGGTSAP